MWMCKTDEIYNYYEIKKEEEKYILEADSRKKKYNK